MKLFQTNTKECIDVLCNKCGESCRVSGDDQNPVFEGIVEYTVSGDYHSKSLDDMTQYTFSVCGKCLKKLFASFKYPVDRQEYSFG